jgi:REP element-mobilizing transposase RayT
MGRAWRIEFEGALYHVLSRGNERREIFYNAGDRRLFLRRLGEMAERYEIEVYAYVLMANHYHILMRTHRANLSKAMHWFGVSYTNRFNAMHGRSGHLFQGRFKSMLVENDAYLLGVSHYIHRNPLRAGIVKRLVDYPWSSYRAYAYGKPGAEWLKTEKLLAQMSNADDRFNEYRKSAQRYADEEARFWENLRHGFILGSLSFVEEIRSRFLPEEVHADIPEQRNLARNMDLQKVIARASKVLGCDVGELSKLPRVPARQAAERDLLIYTLWRVGAWTNRQIGKVFGLTGAAVGQRIALMKSKLGVDPSFQMQITKLKLII